MLQAKNSGSGHTNPNFKTLIAFKPRQVLLAERNTNKAAAATMKQCSTKTLNPDQKSLLLQSVLGYLERNGFSRALKRLLSEAQIETDNWKACSLNLEDLYGKYLETCVHAETNLDTCKDQEVLTDGTNKKSGDGPSSFLEQTVGDEKKKKSNKGEKYAVENRSENGIAESSKNSREILVKDSLADSNAELKAKKKRKKVSDSLQQTEQVITQTESTADAVSELQMDESCKKQTDKKKKKSKSISEPLDANVERVPVVSLQAVNEENSKPSLDEVKFDSGAEGKSKDKKKKKQSMDCLIENVDKSALETVHDILEEKKSSKKRKRLASEENEVRPVEKLASEESKRRKSATLEETKICEKITEVNANAGDGIESKQANGSVSEYELQNTSIKQTAAPTNKNFEKDGVKSATPKTKKKQHEGSVEPKTVNAFQRVKIDEVKFADERLQDNSYWAKDGADVGYGAKAQEVLGQVRGRDFRHEKTKKKRGSYRGGQIDLQTRSVKFNHSDED